MSDPPTISKVEGIGKQVVDALKVSPALLSLMLFMAFTLYLLASSGEGQRDLIKFMVERCMMRPT